MIRDPSDGSVREKPENEFRSPPVGGMDGDNGASAKSAGHNKASQPAVHGNCGRSPSVESGLPPITKNADQLARLERDRDWLKNYLHRKPVVEQGNEDDAAL